MTRTLGKLALGAAAVVSLVVAAQAAGGLQQASSPSKGYPEPRFPSYLQQPKTVDAMMPAARAWTRAKLGFQGVGLGILNKGDEVGLVIGIDADPMVVEAVRRALQERGAIVHVLKDYELAGGTQAEAQAQLKATRTYTSEKGYMEAIGWLRSFPRSEEAIRWLKDRRPDFHDQLFPPRPPNAPAPAGGSMAGRARIGAGIIKFLQSHPNARGVFWGTGGSSFMRRAMHPYEAKYLGLFTLTAWWDLMNQNSIVPGDVWQLSEEQSIEPLLFVDQLTITDPMGTNFSADLTQKQAELWSRGVYHRGHLFMFPHQATGRFGYSVIEYPSFQKEWLPPTLVPANGVIAATNGHGGFYPQMDVHIKDGYVVDVKGGGTFGGIFREFLQYPNINKTTYKYYDKPGFWYLWEIALGTQVKGYRNPLGLERGTATPERERSGALHWGFGNTITHQPDSMGDPDEWVQFGRDNNLPVEHGFHMHTYFSTYTLRLRGANRTVNIIDRGRLTSLDHPEVRALASRYGSPDELLTENWIPGVPGINLPGSYEEFAKDPWKVVQAEMDQVRAGTYPFFHPPQSPSSR